MYEYTPELYQCQHQNTAVMSKIHLGLDFAAIRERLNKEKQRFKHSEWLKTVGVNPRIVTNVHGKTAQRPSLEYIVAVAKATHKPIEYYLWGESYSKSLSEPEIIEVKYEGAENRSGRDRRNGLAYESCDRLLQIERLNRAVFLLTVGDIKSRLWALEHLESPGDTLCNKPKDVEHKPG